MMESTEIKSIMEAALFAAHQPLPLAQLQELFADVEGVGLEQIRQGLEELARDFDGRGVELNEVASGYRFQVRREMHPFVAKLWTERQTRYSRSLLETLALIAYRQPITRGEIEQIRGVAVSTNTVRTLEEREWIRVVGYRDVPGKPALYGTTRQFLDYFNLVSLDQMPPLSELRDLEELTPELALGDVDGMPLPEAPPAETGRDTDEPGAMEAGA
jgi:segregation and condensation protein B